MKRRTQRPAQHDHDDRPLEPRSGGQALSASLREALEPRFSHNLANVRIYPDDPQAVTFDAHAYAVGSQIGFRSGEYQPDTPQGLHVLAHELAHVVQNERFGISKQSRISHRDDDAERDAHRAASSVLAGGTASVSSAPSASVARITESERAILAPPIHAISGGSRAGGHFLPGGAVVSSEIAQQQQHQHVVQAQELHNEFLGQVGETRTHSGERAGNIAGGAAATAMQVMQARNEFGQGHRLAGASATAGAASNAHTTGGQVLSAIAEHHQGLGDTSRSVLNTTSTTLGAAGSGLGLAQHGMQVVDGIRTGHHRDATIAGVDSVGDMASLAAVARPTSMLGRSAPVIGNLLSMGHAAVNGGAAVRELYHGHFGEAGDLFGEAALDAGQSLPVVGNAFGLARSAHDAYSSVTGGPTLGQRVARDGGRTDFSDFEAADRLSRGDTRLHATTGRDEHLRARAQEHEARVQAHIHARQAAQRQREVADRAAMQEHNRLAPNDPMNVNPIARAEQAAQAQQRASTFNPHQSAQRGPAFVPLLQAEQNPLLNINLLDP